MSIVLPKTLAERQAGIKAKRNASSIPYDMVRVRVSRVFHVCIIILGILLGLSK